MSNITVNLDKQNIGSPARWSVRTAVRRGVIAIRRFKKGELMTVYEHAFETLTTGKGWNVDLMWYLRQRNVDRMNDIRERVWIERRRVNERDTSDSDTCEESG